VPIALLLLLGVPSVADADVSYGYDRLGRITTALYDNGLCIVYTYDANGNRTSQLNVAPPPQSPAPLWGAPNWNSFDWNSAPQYPVWGRGGVWGCFKWTPP
jgi:YD repeat-containing protein